MSLVGRILGRFGYVKLDAHRRALLADAEARAGLSEPVLPPALPLPSAAGPPPVPPRRKSRSVPPPLPRSVAPAGSTPALRASAPAPEVCAPTTDEPEAPPARGEDDEWEWRLMIARARARDAA